MDQLKPGAGSAGWVWHPIDLPDGYHAVPRGQAWQAQPTEGSHPERAVPPTSHLTADGMPHGS